MQSPNKTNVNKQLITGFAFCMLVLLAFSSCQRRYGHIQKVRVNDKVEARQKKVSKERLPHNTIDHQTLPSVSRGNGDTIHQQDIQLVAKDFPQKRQVKKRIDKPIRETFDEPANSDPKVEKKRKPLPRREDIRLGGSNFKEIFYLSIILTAIGGLIFFGLFGVALVSTIILDAASISFLFFDYIVLIIALLGLILVPVLYLITRGMLKTRRKMKVKYGNTEYTIEEIERMPWQIRLRRTSQNLLAWFILLIPMLLLGVIGFVTLGLTWFLLPGFALTLGYLLFKIFYLIFWGK